ncbi:zinc-finger homeodomain protein 2 [Impatiens glandulifera]|uniref:zinc-finger homeodomain protein 2 n=1 Tax=Impatiens glandulifera TaxID=253017 RepID=UPI001FB0EB69|nr:zinc-finger homeodomain protein 2 [Impatiens glandulifera]
MEFDEHDQEETGNPNYEPEVGDGSTTASRKTGISYRYRECLKNHAVGIGGHAVDGCGEFIASGEEGTLDALSCAACNCHRNFHRKEPDSVSAGIGIGGGGGGGGQGFHYHHHHGPPPSHLHHHHHIPYYRTAAAPSGYLHVTPQQSRPPLALPPSSTSRDDEDMSNPSSSGGGGGGGGIGGSKKRFRTKFSQEQKDRMLGFAERVGWRIQKHDEAAVEQFCEEMGVKRQVLKVWMHNNKHTIGKKP